MLRVSEIFAAHGGPSQMARALGVQIQTAHRWKQRGSIPPRYWSAIAGLGKVTAGTLAEAHAPVDARSCDSNVVQSV